MGDAVYETVYPRVCGGTRTAASSAASTKGLSPRVRGNPQCATTWQRRLRSIPACAGEPRCRLWRAQDVRVYPRVCGGTDAESALAAAERGLSPRVRGNRPGSRNGSQEEGSIPACAGEPRRTAMPGCGAQVYPRVCGGTADAAASAGIARGLSPRVRGNRADHITALAAGGSIPACAGEPRSRCRGSQGRRVYPRVCGGTSRRNRGVTYSRGLSPRVRGNPFAHPAGSSGGGSIPACAGEPDIAAGDGGFGGVYPRVCGGTQVAPGLLHPQIGLSPRVRGNRPPPKSAASWPRSIPACAGEPRGHWRHPKAGGVYPRVCGGTRANYRRKPARRGLSPRVRGNQVRP